MGVGRRKLLRTDHDNYEYYKEKDIQGYCLFCNDSIYVKNVQYCNTYCNYADLYGSRQALLLWSAK